MHSITVIDNMLPAGPAEEMRAAAIAASYTCVEHDGASYPGMSLTMGSEHEQAMLPFVAKAAGVAAVTSHVSFFRCMHEGVSTGHGNEFRVHYDSGFADQAFVLHLSRSPHQRGGTAFWRHRRLGFAEARDSNTALIGMDANDPSAWDLDALACVQFNRGVLYPARRIHSAHPNEGWGSTPDEARLIWTCLFSVEVGVGNKALQHEVD